MHVVQKFETLLEKYRRPDGRRWSGQEIDEATALVHHEGSGDGTTPFEKG
jgi:hypothetical protein